MHALLNRFFALAQRTLGRLAYTCGHLAEAAAMLQEALATFTTIHAQFEAGRTHLDLAAHAQGNLGAATAHLTHAHGMFTSLQVPHYVERTIYLTREYGITLRAEPPEAPIPGQQ